MFVCSWFSSAKTEKHEELYQNLSRRFPTPKPSSSCHFSLEALAKEKLGPDAILDTLVLPDGTKLSYVWGTQPWW